MFALIHRREWKARHCSCRSFYRGDNDGRHRRERECKRFWGLRKHFKQPFQRNRNQTSRAVFALNRPVVVDAILERKRETFARRNDNSSIFNRLKFFVLHVNRPRETVHDKFKFRKKSNAVRIGIDDIET